MSAPLFDFKAISPIGEWEVLYHVEGSFPTKWHCRCSCGVERDVGAQALKEGRSLSCGGPAHAAPKKFKVGDTLGEFVITEVSEMATIKCRCGRPITMTNAALYTIGKRNPRETCGCNGVDSVYIDHLPNLPRGVKNFSDLVKWAGITRQGYYEYKKRWGYNMARQHLAAMALKTRGATAERRVLELMPPGPPEPDKQPPPPRLTAKQITALKRTLARGGPWTLRAISEQVKADFGLTLPDRSLYNTLLKNGVSIHALNQRRKTTARKNRRAAPAK